MRRSVTGFHVDDAGDWVADLSCFHGVHVRHQPPFQQRPWVLTAEGRRSRLGADVDCVRCDRNEMPPGLQVVTTAGPFDAGSIPAGLRRNHRVAEGRWGLLRVLSGSLEVSLETAQAGAVTLHAGESQALPPGVPHAVTVADTVTLVVDFLEPEPAPVDRQR